MTGFDLAQARAALAGLLVSMAAPAMIRTPGLLMPVRDRTILPASDLEWATILGSAITAVSALGWRGGGEARRSTPPSPRRRVSWTAQGFARIHRMAQAEKRFEAMGLL